MHVDIIECNTILFINSLWLIYIKLVKLDSCLGLEDELGYSTSPILLTFSFIK